MNSAESQVSQRARRAHPALLYTEALVRLVASSDQLMTALRCVRTLNLPSWCIGAGMVRNLVWDALHGFRTSAPADVDVVHFDTHAAQEADDELERRLRAVMPGLNWEIRV